MGVAPPVKGAMRQSLFEAKEEARRDLSFLDNASAREKEFDQRRRALFGQPGVDSWAAALARENVAFAAVERFASRPRREPVPGYVPIPGQNGAPPPEAFDRYPHFWEAQSPLELGDMVASTRREERRRAVLDSSGFFQSLLVSSVAGITSPETLIPVAGGAARGLRAATFARRFLSGGAQGAAGAFGGAAISEFALHSVQDTRTRGETLGALITAPLLGGLIGGTGAAVGGWWARDLDLLNEVVAVDAALREGADGSVGAARSSLELVGDRMAEVMELEPGEDLATAVASRFETPREQRQFLHDMLREVAKRHPEEDVGRVARLMIDRGSKSQTVLRTLFGFYNPKLQSQMSPVASERLVTRTLLDSPIVMSDDTGARIGATVESEAKVLGMQAVLAIQRAKSIYVKHRQPNAARRATGALGEDFREFRDEVGRAMRNGDLSNYADEVMAGAATEAAKEIRPYMDLIFDISKRLGALSDEDLSGTALTYLHRVYDKDYIRTEEGRQKFIALIVDKTEANRTEAEAIVKDMAEGKETGSWHYDSIALAQPVRDRLIKISDNDLDAAGLLVNDINAVIPRYANAMTGQLMLAERFMTATPELMGKTLRDYENSVKTWREEGNTFEGTVARENLNNYHAVRAYQSVGKDDIANGMMARIEAHTEAVRELREIEDELAFVAGQEMAEDLGRGRATDSAAGIAKAGLDDIQTDVRQNQVELERAKRHLEVELPNEEATLRQEIRRIETAKTEAETGAVRLSDLRKEAKSLRQRRSRLRKRIREEGPGGGLARRESEFTSQIREVEEAIRLRGIDNTRLAAAKQSLKSYPDRFARAAQSVTEAEAALAKSESELGDWMRRRVIPIVREQERILNEDMATVQPRVEQLKKDLRALREQAKNLPDISDSRRNAIDVDDPVALGMKRDGITQRAQGVVEAEFNRVRDDIAEFRRQEFRDGYEMTFALNQIRQEYARLIAEERAKKGNTKKIAARVKKLERQRDASLNRVRSFRDQLLNRNQPKDDTAQWMLNVEKGIRTLTMTRLLGGVSLPSLIDTGMIVNVNGLRNTIRGMRQFFEHARSMEKEELVEFLAAFEISSGGRAKQMWDVFDGASAGSDRVGDWMDATSQAFVKFALLDKTNATLKGISTFSAYNRLLKDLPRYISGTLSESKVRHLEAAGWDTSMAKRVLAMWEKHGQKDRVSGEPIGFPRTDRWVEDPSARDAFHAMVTTDVGRSVPTPGIGDLPVFMSKPGWRLLGMFKSFLYAANSRILLSSLARRDSSVLLGVITSVALGTGIWGLREVIAGRDPTSKDVNTWVAEGIDQAGLLGAIMEGSHYWEKMWGGNVPGINMMLGSDRNARYTSKSISELFLGPAAENFETARTLAVSLADDGSWTTYDKRRAARLLPFQNLFYLRGLYTAYNLVRGGELQAE